MRTRDKVAVITGGASGIGAASARLLGREGARVAILDINGEGAATVAGSIREGGGQALEIRCDVSQDGEVADAMRRVVEAYGRLDVLVNNAGVAIRRPAGELAVEEWDRVIDVNLTGVFLCSRHALPHFPPGGGSIIHMASVAGITGIRNRAVYCAAKGALVALGRNMALDYASRGIRVNCICPGFVKTPLIAPLMKDPERLARITAMHPLGRLGEPEDIANAVLFLASDESAWMTAQTLIVDGGFAAGHAEDV